MERVESLARLWFTAFAGHGEPPGAPSAHHAPATTGTSPGVWIAYRGGTDEDVGGAFQSGLVAEPVVVQAAHSTAHAPGAA